MPDGKPTKAPIIIFGTMVTMSIITVGIVFYTHSRRTEPYLDTKMRRTRRMPRPSPVPAVTPSQDSKPSVPSAVMDASTRYDAGYDASR